MRKKKKKRTHALISPPPTFKVFEEQPYFRYHSNPPLSPSLFRSCFFSFFLTPPIHLSPSLSLPLDSKYNCEPLRLALCSSSFGVAQRKGALAPQGLWGVEKSWSEVSTRRFPTPRTVKMLGEIAASPLMQGEMP